MPGFKSSSFSTPSRKLAVLKIGRNTDVLPISVFSSLFGCCENASHHGIGFWVYSGGIEWIIAVSDAQEPGRKLESLRPEPRYLLEDRAGAKTTVGLTVTDYAAGQSFADARDARQQRRRPC
jgi:hypothetical protein